MRYNDSVGRVKPKKEAAMLKLISAIALTLVWTIGLAALVGPGLGSIQDGLESGKRIALARYAEEHGLVP
jgi:hypothetical protein